MRGLIIVIMALDHVHDFFGDLASSPTNLDTTTAALFFTRWITNICAPVFFLLTGTSAYLAGRRNSKPALSRFLLTRGVWLIFLEIVVVRFALQFNVDYQVTILTVLWALGWAMIVLAALVWLPLWAIGAVGAAMVIGHNVLDTVPASLFGTFAPVWQALHGPPSIVASSGRSIVMIAYVLIPWVGVTALGYLLGAAYRWDAGPRRKLLSWLGTGLVLRSLCCASPMAMAIRCRGRRRGMLSGP